MRIDVLKRLSNLAIVGGPCAAIIVYIALPSQYAVADGGLAVLSEAARATIAMVTWMAVWWLTEAVPVPVTALLPIAVFPLLGLGSVRAVTTPYAHPLIFLFLGGFLLSISIEKWALHRWIAEKVVRMASGDAHRLVGGFMGITAFSSMWLSNTATTIMMLPIATSMVSRVDRAAAPDDASRFARCLLLAIAYAASIGGMGTLIGSPPNVFVASYLEDHYGLSLGFRRWMVLALPVVAVLLPATWYLLTRRIAPIRRDLIATLPAPDLPGGDWRRLASGAKWTSAVFVLAVAAWIGRPWLAGLEVRGLRPLADLTDTGIAMFAGLSLFVIPTDWRRREFVMSWSDAEKLPLGTLLLFGGGLTLAATVSATGADRFIGAQLVGLRGVPIWLAFTAVIAGVVFLTELTSNTATTATLVPVLAAAAVSLGLEPFAIIIVTAFAASCAFMMPVATPPNAIVFSSGRISIPEMARAGFVINIVAIVVVAIAALVWVPALLGPGLGR
jgi:solute carrier family 13 (sodium-dependent dicarboxylate transporter), member 2/3/5